MFSKLIIKNFESHKNSVVTFVKGLNVIVGPSDSGKSSIIRSIEWVVKNRPSGDSFKRKNSNETSVSAKFKHLKVTRIKTKAKNSYTFGDTQLTHIGTEVPDKVHKFFNLGEENIQPQDEIFFLLSDSPGKRAKKLNEIGELHIMDGILKEINSDIRSLNAKRKSLFEEYDDVKKEHKNLHWVNKAEILIRNISELEEENKKLLRRELSLKVAMETIIEVNGKLSKILYNLPKKEISKLQNLSMEESYLKEKIDKLQTIINKIKYFREEISKIIEYKITKLIKARENGLYLKKRKERILSIINNIILLNRNIYDVKKAIEKGSNKLKKKLQKLGVCPTCGKEIKNE